MPRLSEILDKLQAFVGLPQPSRRADGAGDAAVLCCRRIDTVRVLVSPDNLTICLLFQPEESYASRRLASLSVDGISLYHVVTSLLAFG